MYNTKIRSNFVIPNLINTSMKEKIKLTEKEEELIRAIRNYQSSYPNGYPQMLYYIQQLVDELTDLP